MDEGVIDIGNKKNVWCYRRCKRRIRAYCKWNQLPLQSQLRCHLFSIFSIIFVFFYTYIVIFTTT